MIRILSVAALIAMATCLNAQTGQSSPVATALAFTHLYGNPEALVPGRDRQLKIKLTASLSKSSELPWEAVSDCFDKTTFGKITGGDAIRVETMESLVKAAVPQSRNDLHEKIRLHIDLLSTQFDLIEEAHRKPAAELVEWVVKNYQSGKPLPVIVICTRNTRRSMLGATMGNLAAAYYGLDVHFSSGGTNPDAFNPRSIATLKEIGVEIEATGRDAPRGVEGHTNSIFRVQWGKGRGALEFSKKYNDAANPQEGFAAILVCSDADASCPKVSGASVRIPVPYLDPKAFDGSAVEAGKYAERRDDEGRFMLSVLMQSRRRLELAGKMN